jgi:hypothetical protein
MNASVFVSRIRWWKKISDRAMHGEKQMQQMALNALLPIITEDAP